MDFHDPWRMVVGDGEGAHRVGSIMPVCNMQGPTVMSARGPYSCCPRFYELANRYTLSRSLPMAPRLTSAELDYIFELDRAGHRPIEIHAWGMDAAERAQVQVGGCLDALSGPRGR